MFNAVLVFILVLRGSMTWLRKLGLSKILPLDHHLEMHALVGYVIFGQASLHTLMHLINFGNYNK